MIPKCPKCEWDIFTDVERGIGGNKYRIVYCSKCGTVIGTLPSLNEYDAIINNHRFFEKRFKDLENKINDTSYLIEQITHK